MNEKKPYRHMGVNRKRQDAAEIVTGKAIFFDDFNLKDVIYGKALRSPYPHARITRIDTTKAEALTGVRAVVTYKNLPEIVQEWRLGLPPTRPVLNDTVNYVGDAVALVAADTNDLCEEAIDLIEVEYEQLEPVYYTQDAVKPGAVQLFPEFPGNTLPDIHISGEDMLTSLRRGDVDAAFEECDIVESGVYKYDKFASPMAMEPPGLIVHIDSGRVKVYGTVQAPHTLRMLLNLRMKMPVDVKAFHVGGSFGNKSSMQTTSTYAGALSAATGRPVKMNLTKTEQLLVHDMRIGINMDAKVG